jgi:hypothetical protein
MPIKKKGPNKKLIIAIVLVAILAIAAAAIVYTSLKSSSSAKKSLVGVQVGDTFTYSITGSSSDPVPATDYPGFYQLNDTKYYMVTITGIEGSTVTLKTDWVFTNGTDIQQQQTIDLTNGMMTNQNGFWGLYPAHLKTYDLIYPVNNTVPINATLTLPYASGNRESAYYHVSTTQYYSLDPTQSTERILYDEVYIDQQTGILTNFNEIQEYNNPELELEVIYALTSSNVWNV